MDKAHFKEAYGSLKVKYEDMKCRLEKKKIPNTR